MFEAHCLALDSQLFIAGSTAADYITGLSTVTSALLLAYHYYWLPTTLIVQRGIYVALLCQQAAEAGNLEAGHLSDATASGPASDDEASSMAATVGSILHTSPADREGSGAGSDSGGSQVDSVSGTMHLPQSGLEYTVVQKQTPVAFSNIYNRCGPVSIIFAFRESVLLVTSLTLPVSAHRETSAATY